MRQAWGKFDGKSGETHPLAHHCMDVAAVFAAMLRLPVVRNRLETAAEARLGDTLCQRLAALVFLHDVGKLHPAFQAKGWSRELSRRPVGGHLRESWEFLLLAAKQSDHPFHETMQQIMTWGEAVGPLFSAAIAHHGRPVEAVSNPTMGVWDSPETPHYDWRAEARTMSDVMRRWFAPAFELERTPLPNSPLFHHAVTGLAALADWIGSDTRFFPYSAPFDLEYEVKSRRAAEPALKAIGFDSRHIAARPAPHFGELTDFPKPRPTQAAVGACEPDARLVILEAETGSGKTEAALWRFTRLFAASRVSSLYFAVPTRAAAKQLHGRVDRALRRALGADAPEAVLAIPGVLRAGEFEGQRLPDWRVRWDDDAQSAPKRWAAEHATRFLAATVAVGTVDQAMLAGLQVKHAHLRGSALGRSLLVIDEVHASDAYMTEVLRRLLDQHLKIGGYAMLMSATLGARARVRWTGEALPEFETARAAPYPAVWVADANEPRAPGEAGRPKEVHIGAESTMDPASAARRAIVAAERGARVLVIRNTVTKAVETWRAVEEFGAERLLMQVAAGPALHHGRFAVEDRVLLENAVEDALAADRTREAGGCIVVGTQTLEQSLDIDADFLISDLCPVDVLLQRIGRLHRHRLPRPEGFETARVSVMLPEDGLDRLAAPAFENGLGGWDSKDGFNGIYRDLAGLELTRRLIDERSIWRIPEMNRELVEGATHPERIADVLKAKGPRWQEYDRRHGGTEAAARMVAGLIVLDRTHRLETLRFPNSDERIMTRLGEEGAILSLASRPAGPFGSPVTRIALPARWSRGIDDRTEPAVEREDSGFRLSVGDWRFRYSREGLARLPR